MECLTHRDIKETTDIVRDLSYSEKLSLSHYDEGINDLLDTINDFKSILHQKSERVNDINNKLEKLTWCTNLDENSLMLMNDLIALAKDLHSSLRRQYSSFNTTSAYEIASQEIEEFKTSIDDLKEIYTDLDSVFFYLPKMPDFVEISKKLSLIK